jgi:hypothetical protein
MGFFDTENHDGFLEQMEHEQPNAGPGMEEVNVNALEGDMPEEEPVN